MSQKKRRQVAQCPHQQVVSWNAWPPTYLFPCLNPFPIPTQPTQDFEDFDPEKAAEEMFFSKRISDISDKKRELSDKNTEE